MTSLMQINSQNSLTKQELSDKKIKQTKTCRQNKAKGFHIERVYADLFREAGFTHCKTTRHTSRLLDSCKIDLNFLPVLVQLKAGMQKGMSIAAILTEMAALLETHIPANYPEHQMVKAIVHHKDKPKERRRRLPIDTIVSLTFDDFLKLILLAYPQGKK